MCFHGHIETITFLAVFGDDAIKDFAGSHSIPFYDLGEIYKGLSTGHQVYDLVISFLFGRILKEPLISDVKYGCINFHPAPLPDYKGRGGCSFAILDKLDEWGCTAHYIDKGIDTGNIIEVRRFPIEWNKETGISLKKKTVKALKELYKAVLVRLFSGEAISSVKQDNRDGRYISKKEMIDSMEIIPGDDIDAKIQAFWFPPHEGAYIRIGGEKYMLINDFILNSIPLLTD